MLRYYECVSCGIVTADIESPPVCSQCGTAQFEPISVVSENASYFASDPQRARESAPGLDPD
jgi:hypothetical protein